MSVSIGDTLPDLTVTTTLQGDIALSSLKGQALVLYFYPKDNTPGCTKQGQGFRDAYADFEAQGAKILGVSRESVRSHQNFMNKQAFPFDLISDPDETLCQAFDVIKEKSMYGKTYLGIERSTFIFDASGTLRHEMRKVKVPGHVEAVLELVKAL